jgi:hypothetical protein
VHAAVAVTAEMTAEVCDAAAAQGDGCMQQQRQQQELQQQVRGGAPILMLSGTTK